MSESVEHLLTSPDVVLFLAVLYSAGKAVTHVLNDQNWVHRPLIHDLQLTDAYHVGSGVQWLVVFWAVWAVAGFDLWTWAGVMVVWAIPWVLLKHLTGKLERWDYLWPVVIGRWAWRRLRRLIVWFQGAK